MLKQYQFIKAPVFSPDYQETTILTEDFHKIMKLANNSLNCTFCPREGMPTEIDIVIPTAIESSQSRSLRLSPGKVANQGMATPPRQFMSARSLFCLKSEPPVQPQRVTHEVFIAKFRPHIFDGLEGYQDDSPLSFLSSRLSQFTKATRIFTTRDYTHTNVAAEFHQACDNIPNTLVIIKSGQYIAGGYTEVAWSSPPFPTYFPGEHAFLFSAVRQKAYGLVDKTRAIQPGYQTGPRFGEGDIHMHGEYQHGHGQNQGGYSRVWSYDRVGASNLQTELLGNSFFKVDEYEVYKLE